MLLRADLYQANGEFILEVDVPGVEPEAIELWIGDDSMTIRGRRSAIQTWAVAFGSRVQPRSHRRERSEGHFERQIPLPLPVLREAAEASVRDGVLTVRVPIREAPPGPDRLDVLPERVDVAGELRGRRALTH